MTSKDTDVYVKETLEQAIAREKSWHISKEIPLTLMVMLIIQLVTAVWFASKLDSRVSTLESNKQIIDNHSASISAMKMEMLEMKVDVKTTKETTVSMNAKLDQLILKGVGK